MRRLPLYCEAADRLYYLRPPAKRLTSPKASVASSPIRVLWCVLFGVPLQQSRVSILCSARPLSCTLFGALLLCVAGVFGPERE